MNTKELIRRIIYFPIFIVMSPFLWLIMSGISWKDMWDELFIESTEDKDTTCPKH